MSYAPQTLLDTRHVYQRYTGLPDASVGIVGDPAHDGGYHCGWDRRQIDNGKLDDYSWEESPRDWNHKTNAASAIDFGWFDRTFGSKRVTLLDFNNWVVTELNGNAVDMVDIREFIYTPDGKKVLRWDRLGVRTSGDSSHLTHSHCSRFRDAENKVFAPFVQRFFNKYVGVDMYMLKLKGAENQAIYLSNGINTRRLPEGQWDLTGAQLQAAGVPLLDDYPNMDSLLAGGGPLVEDVPVNPVPPYTGTLNISGGSIIVGPSEG